MRRHRALVRPALVLAATASLVVTVLPATAATAASKSGALDPTFSGDGIYTPRTLKGLPTNRRDPELGALAVSGKRIWVGAAQRGGRYASVQRINSNGTAASTFNKGYPLRVSFPPGYSTRLGISQIVPVNGGAFVLASGGRQAMVVKVRDNGTIDRSFASSASGRSPVIDLGGDRWKQPGMVVLPDGRVRVVAPTGDNAIVGLRADGRRDASVGANGVTSVAALDWLDHLVLRPGGGLLAVGVEEFSDSVRLKVVRLYRNGVPDTSPTWGENGVRHLGGPLAVVGSPTRPVATPTGGLVIASDEARDLEDKDRAVVRKLTPSGDIDTAFGPGGGRGVSVAGAHGAVEGLAVTKNGKVMVGVSNEIGEGDSERNMVLRLNGTTAALDYTFGDRGGVRTDRGSRYHYVVDLAVDSSGRTLVALAAPGRAGQRDLPGTIRRYRA